MRIEGNAHAVKVVVALTGVSCGARYTSMRALVTHCAVPSRPYVTVNDASSPAARVSSIGIALFGPKRSEIGLPCASNKRMPMLPEMRHPAAPRLRSA